MQRVDVAVVGAHQLAYLDTDLRPVLVAAVVGGSGNMQSVAGAHWTYIRDACRRDGGYWAAGHRHWRG